MVDGKIYVMGGCLTAFGDATPSMEVYDPSTNKWEALTPMPGEKAYHSSSARDNHIYAISGSGPGLMGAGEDLVYKYDVTTDTWAETTSLNQGRWSLSTCTVDSLIICIGGYTSPTDTGQNTVEIIVNEGDQIIESSPIIYKRAGFSSCFTMTNYIFLEVLPLHNRHTDSPAQLKKV